MKKDEDIQTMIDELWLLAKDKLKLRQPMMAWLKDQFLHVGSEIGKNQVEFLFSLHARHVRGFDPALAKMKPGNYWKERSRQDD